MEKTTVISTVTFWYYSPFYERELIDAYDIVADDKKLSYAVWRILKRDIDLITSEPCAKLVRIESVKYCEV